MKRAKLLVTLMLFGLSQIASVREAISGPSFFLDAYGPARTKYDHLARRSSLTHSDKPASKLKDNTLQIQNDVAEMLKYNSCPTRKELEKSLNAVFENSTPSKPYVSRIAKPSNDSTYESIGLKLPPTISGPSQLFLIPREGSKKITKDIVQQWFGAKEAISEGYGTIYEYPWGEVEFSFFPSFYEKPLQITFRWSKSSESDGLNDPAFHQIKRLDEKLTKIDLAYANGERKQAFEDLYWQVGSWSTIEHSTERLRYLAALRDRLIKWNELENKPEVVAYLRSASINEIIETMHQIYRNRRQDFFTATEQAKIPYLAYGELDQDFKGHLQIIGFDDAPIIEIDGNTAAVKEFLSLQKIKLPFNVKRESAVRLSTLPGPLIDRIAEEQDEITVKRLAEREAILKEKYIQDNKDPDKVKLREIQKRRDALDPGRAPEEEDLGIWH